MGVKWNGLSTQTPLKLVSFLWKFCSKVKIYKQFYSKKNMKRHIYSKKGMQMNTQRFRKSLPKFYFLVISPKNFKISFREWFSLMIYYKKIVFLTLNVCQKHLRVSKKQTVEFDLPDHFIILPFDLQSG